MACGCEQCYAHWCQVVAPLLRTLAALQKHHVVHRDIKPENIFLTHSLAIKLGDLVQTLATPFLCSYAQHRVVQRTLLQGLAIQRDRELPFTRSGTLDYMAPEACSPCNPVWWPADCGVRCKLLKRQRLIAAGQVRARLAFEAMAHIKLCMCDMQGHADGLMSSHCVCLHIAGTCQPHNGHAGRLSSVP